MRRLLLLLVLVLAALIVPVQAQDDDPIINGDDPPLPTAQPDATPSTEPDTPVISMDVTAPDNGASLVEVEATDGLPLVGEFFPAYGGDGRAVLLLHQLYTARASWYPQVEPLRGAGFHVLAVDLRGYGATGGLLNWPQAEDDTLTWLAWLATQDGIRADALFTLGTSMGSNLAINGCAAFDGCAGTVALSPGRNYFGVQTSDALMMGKPTLIIYAERDHYPRRDVPILRDLDGFNGDIWALPGNMHGIDLFLTEDTLLDEIIGWLNGRL